MMRRVTTTIAMTLAWAAAAAQGVVEPEQIEYPRYTVEVIIFEYAQEVSPGTEQFLPEEPPVAAVDEPGDEERVFGDRAAEPAAEEQAPIEEPDAYPAGPEFVLLSEEELTMTDLAGMLERLDVYRPLMHFGWTQVTRPEEDTQPIELQDLAPPPEDLDGSFTLYLSRYLHLVVELQWRAPETAIDGAAPVQGLGGLEMPAEATGELVSPPVYYRISEDRIVRNGEVRYYDHPKFGLLAKVTRVEEEAPADPGELLGYPVQ